MTAPENEHTTQLITEVIAEFSEVFAFARTRWSRHSQDIHSELGGIGMIVLQVIYRKGSITATELSRTLDMDKSLVSRELAKLRDLDLIDAAPSAHDGRVTMLSCSAEAKRLVDQFRQLTAQEYRERFAGWSDEELAELKAALHRFNQPTEDSV